MSKKKHPKKERSTPSRQTAATGFASGPYLPVAHPPARNPTLLTVSVILFAAWFLFLLLAALSG
jgi:hypothetical protein